MALWRSARGDLTAVAAALVLAACTPRPPVYGPTTVYVDPASGEDPEAQAPPLPPAPLAADPAQPACSPPSAAAVEQARALFQRGHIAYQEARYDEAAAYFAQAYEADCTAHLLLLNLSRAQELAGDQAAAARALETYLARVPDAPDRAQLELRLSKLRGN